MQFRNNSNICMPTNKGSLSVNGKGYIEVNADTAKLNARVTTESKSLEEAQEQNSRIVNILLTSLYDYGIPKENIHTEDISVTRNYDYTNNVLISYRVSQLISILITDISKLKDVYELVIENGANDDINVDFMLSNPSYYYSKALKKASQDAINKASLLAKNFSLKFNPAPSKITEVSSSLYPTTYSTSSNFQDLAPGLVKVTAEIKAVFTTFPF
ncbi:SIMPL domain-containing protein [Clostridium sp. CCUG 7971]|uniref:SIMPL domain-containing protein n=1 Tax=Clostridium sp. CCUG 7971 TaxID=2811414 RepID=UPI001ABB2338|nr:SIMPL domain-containing protein [Clostridium sp. CCUG 7971]MBO3446305.1 SIMPL domain-containing protein [Clostridium sp. CCUG 7971]